jgi:hypothetical protein
VKIIPPDTEGAIVRYLKCSRCGAPGRIAGGAGEKWAGAKCSCGARMEVTRTIRKKG